MAVAHYGYLVLKMSSPNDVLKIRRDRVAGVSTLEKLQALAAQHEVAAKLGSLDLGKPRGLGCGGITTRAPQPPPLGCGPLPPTSW
jgi:hypothetical protein